MLGILMEVAGYMIIFGGVGIIVGLLAIPCCVNLAFEIGVTASVIAFVGYVIICRIEYLSDNENAPEVKFKVFRDWYSLDPTVWFCAYDKTYKIGNDGDCFYSATKYYIRFGFLSWIQYRVWLLTERKKNRAKEKEKKRIEKANAKRRKQQEENENLELLIRSVQEDIDRIRAKSDREIAQAKEILEGVVNRNDN